MLHENPPPTKRERAWWLNSAPDGLAHQLNRAMASSRGSGRPISNPCA